MTREFTARNLHEAMLTIEKIHRKNSSIKTYLKRVNRTYVIRFVD